MRLWNSGTYALYVQGQNLVPIPVLHSFLFSFKVIGSFHLSQVGAELIDKTWVGWAHVFGLWKSQSIGVNTGFPRWESCCSWNKRKLLQTDSQGFRPVIDNPGNMEFVSRTELGKRRSQAEMSLHFWGVWHPGNIAMELPTEENSGEATAFTKCFSERGSLKAAYGPDPRDKTTWLEFLEV